MTGKMCIRNMKSGRGILCDWWMVGGEKETRCKACYLPDHEAVFSQHM